jgi:hypothetical protein
VGSGGQTGVNEERNTAGPLTGWQLVGAVATVVLLAVGCVVWKYVKNSWLIDHGYLPEGFRQYWIVYAVLLAVLIGWATIRRFRL